MERGIPMNMDKIQRQLMVYVIKKVNVSPYNSFFEIYIDGANYI